MDRLKRDFYTQPTLVVAQKLLGNILVKDSLSGMIVETEAYIGTEDKACHASRRRREICFPMWGEGGFTYVYLTYGMYYMFNVVTEKRGFPSAVLIRALEPTKGIEEMIINRKTDKVENLTNGPGKLSQALGITKKHNNIDLVNDPKIYISQSDQKNVFALTTAKRIGIDYAEEYKEKHWRFFIKDNNFVSTNKN
jgi:DNA-3-methyladenine glycosylase